MTEKRRDTIINTVIDREVVVQKEVVVANEREQDEAIIATTKRKTFIRGRVARPGEVKIDTRNQVTDRRIGEANDESNNVHLLAIHLTGTTMITIVAPKKRNEVALHRRRKSVEENHLVEILLVIVIIIIKILPRETTNRKMIHLSRKIIMERIQKSTTSVKRLIMIKARIATTTRSELPPKSIIIKNHHHRTVIRIETI